MAPKGTFPKTMSRGKYAGTAFETQQEYQNAIARAKGFTSYAQMRAAPLSGKQLAKLSPKRNESYRAALRVVRRMREKSLTFTQAARAEGVDPSQWPTVMPIEGCTLAVVQQLALANRAIERKSQHSARYLNLLERPLSGGDGLTRLTVKLCDVRSLLVDTRSLAHAAERR
jgi:hypothetical protein